MEEENLHVYIDVSLASAALLHTRPMSVSCFCLPTCNAWYASATLATQESKIYWQIKQQYISRLASMH